MKRKVGRPKLDRPPVRRKLISVLEVDAEWIKAAAKGQRRSVTQVIHYAVNQWRQGIPYLLSDRDESERVPSTFVAESLRRAIEQEKQSAELQTHTRQ